MNLIIKTHNARIVEVVSKIFKIHKIIRCSRKLFIYLCNLNECLSHAKYFICGNNSMYAICYLEVTKLIILFLRLLFVGYSETKHYADCMIKYY